MAASSAHIMTFFIRICYINAFCKDLGLSGVILQQTPEEELSNLLTNIIFSVLWSRSGMEGTEDVVWRERGQVFSVLTKLGSSCQLVRPPDDIKRRSVMKTPHVSLRHRTNKLNYKRALCWITKWNDTLRSTYSVSLCCSTCQSVGVDAGFVSVRPEGGPGSGSALLSQSGPAPQAAAGFPVC